MLADGSPRRIPAAAGTCDAGAVVSCWSPLVDLSYASIDPRVRLSLDHLGAAAPGPHRDMAGGRTDIRGVPALRRDRSPNGGVCRGLRVDRDSHADRPHQPPSPSRTAATCAPVHPGPRRLPWARTSRARLLLADVAGVQRRLGRSVATCRAGRRAGRHRRRCRGFGHRMMRVTELMRIPACCGHLVAALAASASRHGDHPGGGVV